MINKIKEQIKPILKDRLMLFMILVVFLAGLAFFIDIITKVKIFDKLIYVRYTVFGLEGFYKAPWTYRIFIAILGLVVAIGHNIVIVKLYNTTSRRFALIASVFSLIVIFVAFNFVGLSIQEIPN